LSLKTNHFATVRLGPGHDRPVVASRGKNGHQEGGDSCNHKHIRPRRGSVGRGYTRTGARACLGPKDLQVGCLSRPICRRQRGDWHVGMWLAALSTQRPDPITLTETMGMRGSVRLVGVYSPFGITGSTGLRDCWHGAGGPDGAPSASVRVNLRPSPTRGTS